MTLKESANDTWQPSRLNFDTKVFFHQQLRRLVIAICVAAIAFFTPSVIWSRQEDTAHALASQEWQAPVDTIVVARVFDPPAQPWLSGHRGVDLDVEIGTEVRAAGSGTVIYAGNLAGRPVISIEHANGLRTTYEPVEPSVSKGDEVSAGQVIGVVIAGHSPGALHWGAKYGSDNYINPLQLLIGSVRLKPWDAN